MLKANRDRYRKNFEANLGLKWAREAQEAKEKVIIARREDILAEVEAQVKKSGILTRIDRRPWHERFVEWVTGC